MHVDGYCQRAVRLHFKRMFERHTGDSIVEGHRFIALSLDSVFFYYAAENPLSTSL